MRAGARPGISGRFPVRSWLGPSARKPPNCLAVDARCGSASDRSPHMARHGGGQVPRAAFLHGETDLPAGWLGPRWRVQNFHDPLEDGHDRRFVDVEALLEFLLQGGQLARQFPAVGQGPAHREEGPHHVNAHPGRPRAVEDVGRHEGAVFREGLGTLAGVAVFLGTGHKL